MNANKQSEIRAWFVTIAAFIIALIIVITNKEWNPYNTVIVGGGLGLGPLLLTALKVWKGVPESDGSREERNPGETYRNPGERQTFKSNEPQKRSPLDTDPNSPRMATGIFFHRPRI